MAGFSRTNGDNLPVLNYDRGSYVNSGANAVQSDVAIQPQGPYLAFYTVTGTGALSGDQITTIITTAEQLATVMVYEYYNAENDSIAMALYPIDAWDTASLKTQIEAGLTAIGIGNAVTVTNQALFIGDEYVPVATVPDAPTNAVAVAVSATSALVTFVPQYDGGSGYIQFRVLSSPDGISTSVGGAVGTWDAEEVASAGITIDGLTPETSYTFTVTAYNEIGVSSASSPSNSITTPAA